MDYSKSILKGTYTYTAIATAANGEAQATVEQTFTITKTCTSTERSGIEKSASFIVPESTEIVEDVFLTFGGYVSDPLDGCE